MTVTAEQERAEREREEHEKEQSESLSWRQGVAQGAPYPQQLFRSLREPGSSASSLVCRDKSAWLPGLLTMAVEPLEVGKKISCKCLAPPQAYLLHSRCASEGDSCWLFIIFFQKDLNVP